MNRHDREPYAGDLERERLDNRAQNIGPGDRDERAAGELFPELAPPRPAVQLSIVDLGAQSARRGDGETEGGACSDACGWCGRCS